MRKIKTTKSFDKKYIKCAQGNFALAKKVKETIKKLAVDVYDFGIKTHKLHGDLKDRYACSIDYEHRIVFYYDQEYVYLEAIGDHDDVY